MRRTKAMFVCGLLLTVAASAAAQTREKGPWWPHPLWGAEDQAGATNWITPEKVLQAAKLVQTGRVYELGHTYERSMPFYGERTYSLLIPGGPTYNEPFGKNMAIGNDEFLCTEVGQVGTQFDGLAHIGTRMKMADGQVRDVYYNGFTGEEILAASGMRQLGIEKLKPIFTRGILIDVAGYKQVDVLPKSYEVTVEDVLGALERQGMTEDSLKSGDALLFRYGWSKNWGEPEKYNDSPPGIGLDVARWIATQNASMVGSDSWPTEVIPNPDPELVFPVHQELLPKHGIFNLENMDLEALAKDGVYEFLFVFTPVPYKGATGSPGRPLAIR